MRNAYEIRIPGADAAPEPAACLVGDGRRLMRAFAWPNTPLGPVAFWPQSLRTDAHFVKPINAELLESVVKLLAGTPCRDPVDA